jgi:hypothetical protein
MMFRNDVPWVSGPVQVNDLLSLAGDESRLEWAPLVGPRVCQDRAARWRTAHTWDRDGKCIFCSKYDWSDLL